MCEFCNKFDFGNAKAEVDNYGAKILLALGSTRFSEKEQFNYCPVCGKKRSKQNGNKNEK